MYTTTTKTAIVYNSFLLSMAARDMAGEGTAGSLTSHNVTGPVHLE